MTPGLFDPGGGDAANGERLIWLEPAVVDRLTALRRLGESYSAVILRLVEPEPRRA